MAVSLRVPQDHGPRGRLSPGPGGLQPGLPPALALHLAPCQCHRGELAGGAWLQARLALQQAQVQPQRPPALLLAPPLAHAVPARLPAGQRDRRQLAREHHPVHQFGHRGGHQRADDGQQPGPGRGHPRQSPQDRPGALPLVGAQGGAGWGGPGEHPTRVRLPARRVPLPAPPEGRLLRPVPVCAAAPLPVGQAQVPVAHTLHELHGYLEDEPLTLQLFIGTADDRLLRPHAFYQVHRITGKTVSTTSHEAVLSNTKVLEIPLLPENNMRAVIDCAGILKLRNSDIELRKGETDIGRKNTRVRLVFRVHVPQPSGRTLSLQVASNPIECSQRSAQELPLVEKQSMDSYPVSGGKKMVLSGHNFLQDSKVIFVEKAPDGHHVWEMEAKTDRDLCQPHSLVVEIPPFRNQRITSPVQVSFYVCNGKRKRSQFQHFTYLPASVPIIKTEPTDDYEPALTCGPTSQGLSPLPRPCYSQQLPAPPDPGSCLLAGFPACPPRGSLMPAPPLTSPKLHDLSSAAYTKGLGHLGLQQPAGEVPPVQEVPGALAVHPGPPEQPAPVLQPQVSPPPSSSRSLGHQHSLCPNSPSCQPPPATHEPHGQALPPVTGHPQHRLPKVQGREFAAAGPRPLPEVREDSSNLAPIPVTVKREPEELDQLYLDDVNEIIRNDLSSANTHS
uniref:RHD domain-containing protein n=1 Tax=Oryctolagus cuniculus TaxID=9986 RepID=G1SR32_RABIT